MYETHNASQEVINNYTYITSYASRSIRQSSPQCLQDHPLDKQWRCFFAPTVLKYAKYPTFGILMMTFGPNYTTDVGSGGTLPGWCACQSAIHANKSLHLCNFTELERINQCRDLMVDEQATQQGVHAILRPAVRNRSGAFLHSCATKLRRGLGTP